MKGRNRFVKPEFFKHGVLYDLEHTSQLPIRLAYIGLWTLCDREGRFEWKPREIKADIFPYEGSVESMARMLDLLRANGFIVQYTVGGRGFGWVPRFKVHQYVNPQEAQSRLPEPSLDVVRAWESSELRRSFGDSTPSAEPESRQSDSTEPTATRHTSEFASEPDEEPTGEVAVDSNDASNKLGFSGSITDSNHNDLENRSRVNSASASRSGPADGACIPEQNRTEQNQNGNGEQHPSSAGMSLVTIEDGARALPAIRGKRTGEAVMHRFVAVLDEVTAGTRTRLAKTQQRTLQAELVFAYWIRKFNHPRALLDKPREAVIMKRLEENGGDVSELLYALDGATRDDWVTGQHPKANHPNDGVDYILRNRERIEQYANVCKGYKQNAPHPTALKYGAAVIEAENGGQLVIDVADTAEITDTRDDRAPE